MVVFGTGEGATNPPSQTGQLASDPLPRPLLPVRVRIDGIEVEVLFAGAAPGFAGVLKVCRTCGPRCLGQDLREMRVAGTTTFDILGQ